MKRALVYLSICSIVVATFVPAVGAQDEARAAWQVTNFDITVASPAADRTLNAKAVLVARNVGRGAGMTLTLRINQKAEIKSASVGSAPATYLAKPDNRGNSQRVTINLPGSVGANENVTVAIEYRLPITENTGLSSISAIDSQFLPQSMWYPMANDVFALRGADYAPFRLTVTGGTALSSGVEKSAGGNSVFEQPLNAQPFFITGAWDRVDGGSAAKNISAFIEKGANPDDQKQAAGLIGLANDARAFYSTVFGSSVDVPIRLISVTRGAGFDDAGSILLSEGSFQRKKVDATSAMSISEAVARLWLGGQIAVRGEGYGVLREGLAKYLATLFIEKQFGPEAAEAERARERVAYAGVAKRDGPLSRTTPLDGTYLNTVANKGAMVWRLIDHIVGREAFVATLRGLIANSRNDPAGVSLDRTRNALVERGGDKLKAVLDQQFDQMTDTDLLVGLPHQEGGRWVAALRNLGSMEAIVNVSGTDSRGQRITTQAIIPAHDFGQATFTTTSPITAVEVDPDKFYPQLDYANDFAPRVPEVATALAEANRMYGAQDFAKSESLARQLLAASPGLQEARIILARALLAANKYDEAEREFKQLLNERLPLPTSLAWASLGLGEIAARRGQTAEASRDFTDAIRADGEYASTLAARAARIRVESTTGAPPVDEAVRTFIGRLDVAIKTGRQAEIAPMMMPGELTRFVQQIVGTQPEAWQTRVLRTEQLDANRVAADVALNTRQLGVDHSGTAVFVLTRVNGSLKLSAIEFFEVK